MTAKKRHVLSKSFEAWPIFVISLHDAAERRAKISRQLENLELSFEIVDATDGRAGLTPEQEQLIDRPGTLAKIGRKMTDAEYACALSHFGLWQRVVDHGLLGGVILEDDAIVGRTFADFLISRGYLAAPIVTLDHEGARAWRWKKTVCSANETRLVRLATTPFRTTGYTISSSGAAFLAANSLPLRHPADWPCNITRIKSRAAIPRLVNRPEDGSNSTIAPSRNVEFLTLPAPETARREPFLQYFRSSWWRKKFFRRFTYRIS